MHQIMNVPLSFPIGSLVISKQKLSSFKEESAEVQIPVVAENRAVFDFLSAIMPYDSLNILPGPRDFFCGGYGTNHACSVNLKMSEEWLDLFDLFFRMIEREDLEGSRWRWIDM